MQLFSNLLCIVLFLIEGFRATYEPSIIVIGSGASGIAAATKLLNNNFTNVKILEAENRIGGRINSVKFGDAYVDLGAEFCHGEHENIVYSMVKDLNILRHSSNKNSIFFTSNSSFDGPDQIDGGLLIDNAERLFATKESILKCENATSIGQCLDIYIKSTPTKFLTNKTKEMLQGLKTWMNNYICLYDSPFDLYDLTPTTDYKVCAGDLQLNWNGRGYKTILEVMLENYLERQDQLITLGREVVNISNWKNDKRVTVITKDGTILEADHVIFTPSVGVLKAKHILSFTPNLPNEKIEAIENIGFGAAIKVVLHFPEKWWEAVHTDTLGVIWMDKDVQELRKVGLEWLTGQTHVTQAPNNPHVWIVWYAGPLVHHVESLSDKAIFEGHKYFFKNYVQTNVSSEPDEMIRSNWYKNPHFRGTYSYESVKGHSKGGGNFQKTLSHPLENSDGKPMVLFAGEATHSYYFSTVHGAIETGYREADRLIKFYEK